MLPLPYVTYHLPWSALLPLTLLTRLYLSLPLAPRWVLGRIPLSTRAPTFSQRLPELTPLPMPTPAFPPRLMGTAQLSTLTPSFPPQPLASPGSPQILALAPPFLLGCQSPSCHVRNLCLCRVLPCPTNKLSGLTYLAGGVSPSPAQPYSQCRQHSTHTLSIHTSLRGVSTPCVPYL